MKIGVIRTSRKSNEKRVPIYPEHLPLIDSNLRKKLIFELNYGSDFGFSDDYFCQHQSNILSRDEILKSCDLLIIPKPVVSDLNQMTEGQILWGWMHCVQNEQITQSAIDNRLTLIAWEAMHHWSSSGNRIMHIFYKNNEIAGYAAVLHSLALLGLDGHYGPRRRVSVIGYGSVSRGAIYALQGRGFNNIHVYTRRKLHHVADQNPDVYYHHLDIDSDRRIYSVGNDGTKLPFIHSLAKSDIVCNGTLQDTDDPLLFVNDKEVHLLKPRSLIIDISCDEGMGFSFAKPTSFDHPIFTVGDNISYYSVDHTPTYLWNAASREISKAVLAYLPTIAQGEQVYIKNATIKNSIEIDNGYIKNKKILSFQNRKNKFPHAKATNK